MSFVLPEEYRAPMCGNKRSYNTNKEAKRIRRAHQISFPKDKMDVYHCPFCGYYHMGHKLKLSTFK